MERLPLRVTQPALAPRGASTPRLGYVSLLHPRGLLQKLAGWSMSGRLRTELVMDSLEMALWRRKPSAGLIHHFDRGVPYTSLSFGKRLEEAGIVIFIP